MLAFISLAWAAMPHMAAAVPPVPGGCTEPAALNVGKPGCYAAAELKIERSPAEIYWHIYAFRDVNSARAEARKHRRSAVAASHGGSWLYVLGSSNRRVNGGRAVARVGPMRLPRGKPMMARFLESEFPPGMRTRVHSHPGPEGFYVLAGEQCMETPAGGHVIGAGGTFIVASGPHVQSAPSGRKNIAVVFFPPGVPWMRMEMDWRPSTFCPGELR